MIFKMASDFLQKIAICLECKYGNIFGRVLTDIDNPVKVFVGYGETKDTARNGVAQDDIP